ncbi:MAG TPA: M3 family oligoendopeptidase [Gemmatimonadales bacterium]|nr:M3 family oligoendopeptidase [Gemmatimonadales bacterium]
MGTSAIATLTPADFAQATWDEILPLYQELAERPLTAGAVKGWLADWSRLEVVLSEAAALAMIAYTCDTADPAKEAAHLRFSADILPRMEEQGVRLAGRLLATGYSRPDLEVPIAKFRTAHEIFREANVPLMQEVEALAARYQKIAGGITVVWDGEEKTVPQLQPYLQSPDRGTRELAWRLSHQPYLERREELADVFDAMFDLRTRIARNAGFADYEAYAFKAKCRFDYTPADCRRFHEAVEAAVVPAVERVLARRRERLGLSALRPWDLANDPEGRPPLRPFRDASELVATCQRIFDQVSPRFGRHFRTMAEEGLLDLASRKGKAPGGYCETLHYRGRPFIFMNAVGVWEDVSTLLHEAGHAFHAFEAHRHPLIWQRHPGLEACELASMSMELLAAPYLGRDQGGFFDPEELARARTEHLEDILMTLAHVASVDAFQSWLYTSGQGRDRDERDRAWLRIRSRFERGVDWGGLEPERVARWYRQLHIFLYPFYYIEYGIAQLGALQIWRNSRRDPAGAVERYRQALALGNTASLPDLFRTAGAALTFDRRTVGDLVALVEEELAAWQGPRV